MRLESTSPWGSFSQHPAPHPQAGSSTAVLGLLLFVLSALWSETGLDETAWVRSEGEAALLKAEERKEGLFNRSLSKLLGPCRAPRAAACCSRGGPKKSWGKLCSSC